MKHFIGTIRPGWSGQIFLHDQPRDFTATPGLREKIPLITGEIGEARISLARNTNNPHILGEFMSPESFLVYPGDENYPEFVGYGSAPNEFLRLFGRTVERNGRRHLAFRPVYDIYQHEQDLACRKSIRSVKLSSSESIMS